MNETATTAALLHAFGALAEPISRARAGICEVHAEHAPGNICLACLDGRPEKCLVQVPAPEVPK